MAQPSGKKPAGKKSAVRKGEKIPELIYTLAITFFRMRAIGQREGAVTSWGGGTWGLLHTLREEGPLTVPEIARRRPMARQHIQRVADDAVKQGFLEFVPNPAHKRSKLLQLTKKGHMQHDHHVARMAELGAEWTEDITLADIETTIRTLKHIRERATQDGE